MSWSECPVDIDAVHDDWEGFRIWIRSHNPTRGMLIVRFDMPLFYCSSDEGDRLSPLHPPQPNLDFPHVFWTIEDSELLKIFHHQSCNIHADCELAHYAFLSCNACVDVVSRYPPHFTGDVEGKMVDDYSMC
jgi:hypothetical protein